jgi:hypothetical protein
MRRRALGGRVDLVGDAGALAAEQQDVAGLEGEVVERLASLRS